MIPYGILSFMSFGIITGGIFGAACLVRFMFAPKYAIYSVYSLGYLCGAPILLIKLILGLIILILFVIILIHHLHPFLLPLSIFLL